MIVKMKKIIVLCTQANQDDMLESLRSLNVLHLDKINESNNEQLDLSKKSTILKKLNLF